jgi:hypothetical protein
VGTKAVEEEEDTVEEEEDSVDTKAVPREGSLIPSGGASEGQGGPRGTGVWGGEDGVKSLSKSNRPSDSSDLDGGGGGEWCTPNWMYKV